MTVDEQLLNSDREARSAALDVTRSFIVQAPAGSGKTELLIQRFLNLLSVVDYPEEVVAITFTRKAAAEMQLRVIEALQLRQSGAEPLAEHEKLTYDLAGRALSKSDALDWNLITNPRRMRILTLDALNASIARSQPLTSTGTGARVVVGAEMDAVLRDAAIATLDWLGEKSELQSATVEVLQHVDNNTWLYTSYLAQMLATRDQWLPFIGSGSLSAADAVELRARSEESLDLTVTEHLRRVRNEFATVASSDLFECCDYAAVNMLASGDGKGPIGRLEGVSELPGPVAADLPKWQAMAALLLTGSGQFRKRVDKRQGFPPGDKARKDTMHALLESMAASPELATSLHSVLSLPPTQYTDEQWQVLLAVFRLLPLAVSELKRLFDERGISDHIDVALTASAALGSADSPGDVALLLDYQVKHLLVDEMQDTSAAQYRMLETLTGGWQAGDARSLYCVGDPMQSIYRFRNAEVGQFLLAQDFGIGQIQLEPLLLRRNFRSGERLVNWFNDVFPGVLAAKDDPLRGAVSYSEAVPVESLEGQGSCQVHALFDADADDEAAAGCRVIMQTLDDNPDHDMAVLVRGRTQLPQLLARLRAAGVPYRAVEIDRLTDLPEVIDVLALTRAAAHQGDRIAWLALLRAPWIGLDWTDLHKLVSDDVNCTVWEALQSAEKTGALSNNGQKALQRARDVLESLVRPRRTQSLRDLVERAWFAMGGPATLRDDYAIENVYRYFDVLSGIEHAGTLVDVGELESILDMERVSSAKSARLQIMTMHRAKGLQFDHVLLYGLGRQPGKGERRVLSWFDLPARHGMERKVISPVGPRAEVNNDPIHRYIELTHADKDRQEQGRLLYVACTRAKKSLHLMGSTAIAADGQGFRAARSDSLLHLLWPSVEAEFERQFKPVEIDKSNAGESLFVKPVLRRFEQPWTLPVVENPAVITDVASTTDENESKVEFYWVGGDARIAGTLVHRWLQLIAEHGSESATTDRSVSTETTMRWLRESGIPNDAALPIAKRVEEAVAATLQDPKGRWILEGPGHSELALRGVFEGEVVGVILDRVRIADDGAHWIVDYKTSSHEGGNLEGFLQVEADRYRPQLQRYASLYSEWAGADVKCALYFPLLKSFVEIAV